MRSPLIAPLPPLVRAVGPGLWVWDESEVDPQVGGNKVRKLLHLLPEALAAGAEEVVTVGGIGSHHVLATALLAARCGLPTHAVLFDQPERPDVVRHLARIERACASVRRVRDPVAAVFLGRALARGRRAWIPPGGTSPTGVRGWVEAAREVARRLRSGEWPLPERVVVALGTGGTAAGLLGGFGAEGLGVEVVAARVVPRWVVGARRVRRLARSARGVAGATLPRLTVVDALHGGYGAVDDEVLAALAAGAARGVPLEPTYTAKAFAAALRLRGPTWFVATAPRPPAIGRT